MHPALCCRCALRLRELYCCVCTHRRYAARNPIVGYCQSMNFIAATLLLFSNEQDAFWTMTGLLETHLVDYYSTDLSGVQADARVLGALLQRFAPAV